MVAPRPGVDGAHRRCGTRLAGDAAVGGPVAQDPLEGRQSRREVRELGHVAVDARAADAKLAGKVTGKVEGFLDLGRL